MRAVFYGLGADGTVGANKNSVKIIAEDAGLHAQGYFVYDSHKSGAQTVSHLRFGPQADPRALPDPRGQFRRAATSSDFLERQDVLRLAAPGGTFLLNSPYGPDEVWDHLPRSVQQQIIDKRLRFFVIDAIARGREVGLRGAHQHRAADLLLRDLRRAAARRGDRADQEGDQQDLRHARARRWCGGTSRRSTPRSRDCTR